MCVRVCVCVCVYVCVSMSVRTSVCAWVVCESVIAHQHFSFLFLLLLHDTHTRLLALLDTNTLA